MNPKEGPLLSFFRLMIEDGGPDGLWVKIDEASANKFQRRFDEFWARGQPIVQERPPDRAVSGSVGR